MQSLDIALASIGFLILATGLASYAIKERLYISQPLLALALGVAIGPFGLDWIDLNRWGDPLVWVGQAARLTLAIGVMEIALRLPPRFVLLHWRPLVMLLAVGMPLMWLSSGLVTYWILGGSFWVAMLIGAAVTPTDPIVASSIVTGNLAEKNLPENIRHSLSAESGANDGLAHLIVMVPMLVLLHSSPEATTRWLVHGLLEDTLEAVVFGGVCGWIAARTLAWSEKRGLIDYPSLMAHVFALAMFVLGMSALLGTNGILAVFTSGLVFDLTHRNEDRVRQERMLETVNQLVALPMFVLFGLVLPWQSWSRMDTGTLVPLVGGILLLRRIPFVLLLHRWIRPLQQRRAAWFAGWFGPIGVAAIFYATEAVHQTGHEKVWTIASLLTAASIVAHGITATPWTRSYPYYEEPAP